MFRTRLIVGFVLLPLGLVAIVLGGWAYGVLLVLALGRAAWEYGRLFHSDQSKPAVWMLVTGVVAIAIARVAFGFELDPWLLTLLAMVALTVHLIDFERGRQQAASDFAATLSGMFYIGMLGSYLVMMRQLPNGLWWVILTFFAVWLADTTAYIFGTRYGRHKMTPRLSPKKSWEGFVFGLIAATLGTPVYMLVFRVAGLPDDASFSIVNAAILGFVVGALSTLGDVGISMIKRQMKVKDASQILPGHGGILDRIDSWLWAFPIGYYLILFVFLQAS
jgi:phosphatidate cytidylyltransferase